MGATRAMLLGMAGWMVAGSPHALAQGAQTAPVAATAPTASGAAPAATPIEAYARIPFVEEPVLSPDGEWIAGIFAIGANRHVCILPLVEERNTPENRACLDTSTVNNVHGIEWVGNANIILHVTVQQPVEGNLWYIRRLLGFNRQTRKLMRLGWDMKGQTGDDVLWVAQDGSPNIVMAAQNSIYEGLDYWPTVKRMNVQTGDYTTIQAPREFVMNWVADNEGKVRLGYSYDDDSRKARLFYRKPGTASLVPIGEADTRKGQHVPTPVGFVPGTEHVLLIRDNDAGEATVAEVDLDGWKTVKTLYTAPKGSWISGVHTHEGSLMSVWLAGKQREKVWLDPTLAELQAQFAKAVPTSRVHGKKDTTVDYSQSTAMNGRMKDAGKKVEMVLLPEADHYFNREADRVSLLKAVAEFLQRNNPAG
jgi:dipeptidyl aminopeptidase/acylaminoacyl peptidase